MPKSAGTSVSLEANPVYLDATYSPVDKKLRMFSPAIINEELFDRLKKAGFRWNNRQFVFVAPFKKTRLSSCLSCAER